MAPARKVAEFHGKGNDWFCNAGLLSDVTVVVDGENFHLHKFPLISRSGKMAKELEENRHGNGRASNVFLEGFPGGPDSFLIAAKFCYGLRVELSPKNIAMAYCAADYLEMTDEYGEDNLLPRCDNYLHKNVLRNWKDCILALQSAEPVTAYAEKLQIISKCMNAISTMVCTDPSLFGWPMKMYGSLQSPGGSILWNGINTGARIRSLESDWWYEDVSYLGIHLFAKLVKTMKARGIRSEYIAGVVMYYARKYLPGSRRWKGAKSGAKTAASLRVIPTSVDQRILVEVIVHILPEKRSKSYCRFLLGLLRISLILGVSQDCIAVIERRIGEQLELATLDDLLIPSYSDSDTLYDTSCFQRILPYFLSSERKVSSFSPSSHEELSAPSSPLIQVAKLVDNYIAEVASDVNLKPNKIKALAEALPEDSRSLHDGLYRGLDIYFKAHPWLSDGEKENLCSIIDYQKLSIDACAHASQNELLPLRVVLQVLFFEQMQLRTALVGRLEVVETENEPANPVAVGKYPTGLITRRDRWLKVVHENRDLKVDLESMSSRVTELEQEFDKIRLEMKKVTRSHSSLSTPRLVSRRMSCRLLPRVSETRNNIIKSTASTPRASVEKVRSSHPSMNRASLSFL